MVTINSRRNFLKTTTTAGAIGLADLSAMPGRCQSLATQDGTNGKLPSDSELFTRLLEETPRGRLAAQISVRAAKGLDHHHLMAALLLASVRSPAAQSSEKLGPVMALRSAHLASISSEADARWQPMLWALDYFKQLQAEEARRGKSTAKSLDLAATSSRRADTPDFESLLLAAIDDLQSLGPKVILLTGAVRVLQANASLNSAEVFASLRSNLGAATTASRHEQSGRARVLRADWASGEADEAATTELLGVLRSGSADRAANQVVAMLNRGAGAQSVWDALMLSAVEQLSNHPSSQTRQRLAAVNALRYAWERVVKDDTRRLLILQATAFVAGRARGGSATGSLKIERLAADASANKPISQALQSAARGRATAMGQLAACEAEHGTSALIRSMFEHVFSQTGASHEHKAGWSLLEDYGYLAPAWRSRYLAACCYGLLAPEAAV